MKLQLLRLPLIPMISAVTLVSAVGCKNTIEVKPIKVEPIHMTLDINIRVDRELDEFFEFEKEFEEPAATAPDAAATVPAQAPAPVTSGGAL